MTTAVVERRELHRLIDVLPDYKATALYSLLLVDDEPPLTDDELAQLAAADDEIAKGEYYSLEEFNKVMAELP